MLVKTNKRSKRVFFVNKNIRQLRIARRNYRKKRYEDRSRRIQRIKYKREKKIDVETISKLGFKGIIDYLNKITEFKPRKYSKARLIKNTKMRLARRQPAKLRWFIEKASWNAEWLTGKSKSIVVSFGRLPELLLFDQQPKKYVLVRPAIKQNSYLLWGGFFVWSWILSQFWKLANVFYLDWYFEWPCLFLEGYYINKNFERSYSQDTPVLLSGLDVKDSFINVDSVYDKQRFCFSSVLNEKIVFSRLYSWKLWSDLCYDISDVYYSWQDELQERSLPKLQWAPLFTSWKVSRINVEKVNLHYVFNRYHKRYLKVRPILRAFEKIYLRYITLVKLPNKRRKITVGFQNFVKRVTKRLSNRLVRKVQRYKLRVLTVKDNLFSRLFIKNTARSQSYDNLSGTHPSKEYELRLAKLKTNVLTGSYFNTFNRRYKSFSSKFGRSLRQHELFMPINEETRPMCDLTLTSALNHWRPVYSKLRKRMVRKHPGNAAMYSKVARWAYGRVYLNLLSSSSQYLLPFGSAKVLADKKYLRKAIISMSTKGYERKAYYTARRNLKELTNRLPYFQRHIDIERTIVNKFLFNITNLLAKSKFDCERRILLKIWFNWHKPSLEHSRKSRWISFSKADIFEFE